MPRPLARFFLLLALLAHAGSVHAQETWTRASAPTTQDLWGICHGQGRFVAVGTNGTILTSTDATTWTIAHSGTTDWLTAVAFGEGLFVAVGDRGTVLTSADAVTWTRRTSGTIHRLNGIACDGRFLAVGENGTLCRSADGETWTAVSLPLGTWLRGIAATPQGFLIGDGTGRLFLTSDAHSVRYLSTLPDAIEAVFWANGFTAVAGGGGSASLSADLGSWFAAARIPPRNLRGVIRSGQALIAVGDAGTVCVNPDFGYTSNGFATVLTLGPANLNAIATSDTATVIVGAAGSIHIATAEAGAGAPALAFREPVRARAGLGQSVEWRTLASGRPVVRYQWFHNGSAIPGETGDTLRLGAVRNSDAGAYTVRGYDARGVEANAYTQLEVALMPPTDRIDLRLDAVLAAPPTAVSVQADGMVLIAAPQFFYPGGQPQYGLARFTPEGVVDASFRLPAMGFRPGGGVVTGLSFSADGRIVVAGYSSGPAGDGLPLPCRLHSDGSFSDSNWDAGPLMILPDGRRISVNVVDNVATVTRQAANGGTDPSFPAMAVRLDGSLAGGEWFRPSYGAPLVAKQQGAERYLVSTSSHARIGTAMFGMNGSALFRLRGDGTVDDSVPVAHLEVPVDQLVATGDGFVYRASWCDGSLGSVGHLTLGWLDAQGLPRDGHEVVQFATPVWQPVVATLLPDGGALVATYSGIQCYDPRGVRDPTFAAEYALATNGNQPSSLRALHGLPDGRFVLVGDLRSISGLPARALAVITPSAGAPPSRLVNLSIRTTAGSGDGTLIVGFVIDGNGSRAVLARAVGPGLIPLGLGAREVLADPQLKVFQRGTLIGENDDWDPALTSIAAAVGAQPLPAGSRDAAALAPLTRGAYTAHVGSATAGPGIALVELYDAEPATSATSAQLVNVSGRAHVGLGANVLIAGFVITGEHQKRLLIRGIGPGLATQGVTGILADPLLELHRGDSIVAQNDNWVNVDAPTFASVGAFALAEGSRDAAMVVTLPAGVYSALVRGVGDTTGNAMIEIYEVR